MVRAMTTPGPRDQTDSGGVALTGQSCTAPGTIRAAVARHPARPRVVYVALGSNLGDRPSFLAAARDRLQAVGEVVAVSPIYDTAAVTPTPQPRYYNQVVALRTDRDLRDLLTALQGIEDALGRRRGVRWAPRTIDLDILLDGAAVVSEPDLIVPHPRLAERAFVLIPLADLAPDMVHPVAGRTIAELAAAAPGRDTVSRRG